MGITFVIFILFVKIPRVKPLSIIVTINSPVHRVISRLRATLPAKDSVHPRHPHAIDDVAGQSEGYGLGSWEDLALLEGDSEVDVYEFGRLTVDQDVLYVSVSKTDDVAN